MEIENSMMFPYAHDEATPEREEPQFDKHYDYRTTEMSETELITTPGTELTNFGVTDEALRGLVKKYETFPDPAAGPDEYQAVVEGVKEIRGLRGDVERTRKEKKADIVRDGKIIDGEASRIKDILFGIENPMKDAKEAVDTEKELIELRRTVAIQEKIAALTVDAIAYGESVETLKAMLDGIKTLAVDESFDEFYHDAEQAKRKSLSLIRQALESAQERIDQEQKLEEQRLDQQEERRRLDAERVKRDAAQKQADEVRDAKTKELAEEVARLLVEREQLDQEKEDAATAEKDRQDAEAEAKRLAELEPDKKKLKTLAKDLRRYNFPTVKSNAAKSVVVSARTALNVAAENVMLDLGGL